MSRILRMSMKKKAACALWLVALACCLRSPVMLVTWSVITSTLAVNLYARRFNRRQTAPFEPRSDVRNVDVLIIGDMMHPAVAVEDGQSFVQICAPGRSLRSCFEILRHTHSILDDESGESCVVIAVKRKNMNKAGFSVFDVPFFHRITITRYGLERLRRLEMFSLIVEPLGSMRLMLGIMSRNYREEQCTKPDINSFCEERGYRLKLFVS